MGSWKLRKGKIHLNQQIMLADLNYYIEKPGWNQIMKSH